MDALSETLRVVQLVGAIFINARFTAPLSQSPIIDSGFDDPEGMGLELRATSTPDAPLIAEHPEIPAELALQGFDGVEAFATDPERSRQLFEATLGFVPAGNETWEVRGESRGGLFAFDPPPAERGIGLRYNTLRRAAGGDAALNKHRPASEGLNVRRCRLGA